MQIFQIKFSFHSLTGFYRFFGTVLMKYLFGKFWNDFVGPKKKVACLMLLSFFPQNFNTHFKQYCMLAYCLSFVLHMISWNSLVLFLFLSLVCILMYIHPFFTPLSLLWFLQDFVFSPSLYFFYGNQNTVTFLFLFLSLEISNTLSGVLWNILF